MEIDEIEATRDDIDEIEMFESQKMEKVVEMEANNGEHNSSSDENNNGNCVVGVCMHRNLVVETLYVLDSNVNIVIVKYIWNNSMQ